MFHSTLGKEALPPFIPPIHHHRGKLKQINNVSPSTTSDTLPLHQHRYSFDSTSVFDHPLLTSSTMFAVRSAAVARSAAVSMAPRAAVVSLVRTYATAGSADVKPPVALFGLDGTYASALVCTSFVTIANSLSGWKKGGDWDEQVCMRWSQNTYCIYRNRMMA